MIKIYSGKVTFEYSHNSTYDIDIPINWSMTLLGTLPDAITCEVREEKNGAYELSMTYVSAGVNSQLIATDCILGVECPLRSTIGENYFRIYRVERDLAGHMSISARQISGDLIYFGINKHGLDDPDGIQVFADTYPEFIAESFTAWLRHASNMRIYFTFGGNAAFSTFAPNSGHFMDFCTGTSARAYLGGEDLQGNDRTALQLFSGCAYVWDKRDISLWKKRGQDRNIQITYGTNMAEMACDDDTDGIFTYVCAFYLQNDGTNFRKYVSSLYATDYVSMFAISRIKMFDCSAEVTNKYPEGASTADITAYLNTLAEAERDAMNYAGVPVRNISIDVVEGAISGVYLCDTLPVLYKRNGIEINTRMEIVGYTWDAIMQRYTEITLGAIQMDLAKEIARQKPVSISGLQTNVATIQNEVKEARTDLDKAIIQYVSGAADLNNYRTEGKYFFSGGNNMLTNAPNGAINGWLEVFVDQYSPARGVKQIWHRYGSNPTTFMDEYIRLYASGAWGSWERIATVAVTHTNASTRRTKTIKFGDGTQMCFVWIRASVSLTSQWGSLYYGTLACGDWPAAFSEAPYAVISNQGGYDCWCNLDSVTATAIGSAYLYRPERTSSASYDICIIGIGGAAS